jgi:hypothetical protein
MAISAGWLLPYARCRHHHAIPVDGHACARHLNIAGRSESTWSKAQRSGRQAWRHGSGSGERYMCRRVIFPTLHKARALATREASNKPEDPESPLKTDSYIPVTLSGSRAGPVAHGYFGLASLLGTGT